MQAVDILRSEHRVIERVVDCLEAMADQALEGCRLDVESARQALDFFQNYVDHCHHAKEEQHLFPLLEGRGLPLGPVTVMRDEHERGREHIRAMVAVLDAAGQGDANALAQFGQEASRYAQLLRDHIWKEDNRLFSMAEMLLSHDDQHRLLHAFSNVESSEMPANAREKYAQLTDELAKRFLLKKEASSSGQGRGCFHFGA